MIFCMYLIALVASSNAYASDKKVDPAYLLAQSRQRLITAIQLLQQLAAKNPEQADKLLATMESKLNVLKEQVAASRQLYQQNKPLADTTQPS